MTTSDVQWLPRDLWQLVEDCEDMRVSIIHLPGQFDSHGEYMYPSPWKCRRIDNYRIYRALYVPGRRVPSMKLKEVVTLLVWYL